ncbi:MAG: tetratricopeptide repeat protein [Candidatus Lokiarchaeota archaeon]|nr:tetratricopeptide repeat protein [Candidatus Lokiarchaeota archaeon]MBD3201069.1 tetratricopeptide repeat protein [Candidatus Lokiarchaeota archaeon]
MKVSKTWLAHAYNQVKNCEIALEIAQKVLNQDSNYLIAKYPLAEAQYGLGNVSKAIENLKTITQEKPEYTKPIRLLTKIYTETDQPDELLETLDRKQPKDAKTWYYAAQYFYKKGKLKKAAELNQKALTLDRKLKQAKELKQLIKKIH